MDARIGRYRARMEEAGVILTYSGGISFDLTRDETLALLDFLSAYRQVLLKRQDDQHEVETEHRLQRLMREDEAPDAKVRGAPRSSSRAVN